MTKTTKSSRGSSIASLLKTADSLDKQAIDKLRSRPAHTAKMLCNARSMEREGQRMQRAASYIRSYCRMLQSGTIPEALLNGFVPTKDRFLGIASHVGRPVSNGYHGYSVDTDEWHDNSPQAQAIRQLANGSKSAQQQQAEADQARQLEVKRMIDELRGVNIEGFFPTPDPVIDMMLAEADLQDGSTVLEPSAGIGSICDRVAAEFPGVKLEAIELRPSLQAILKAKGHAVVGEDFLEWSGGQYDIVLMNPPFERGADMTHVRKAFNHVKPGGRLVSIMTTTFQFRQTTKAVGFRAWLGEMDGTVTELPDNAFNSDNAFRRTGVKAVMISVSKPENSAASQPTSQTSSQTNRTAAPTSAGQAGQSEHPNARNASQADSTSSNGQRQKGRRVKSRQANRTSAPTSAESKGSSEHPNAGSELRTHPSGPEQRRKQDNQVHNGNILSRNAPDTLGRIRGQGSIVKSLTAFAKAPHSAAFVFAGPSGVGKTATAHALAADLGCDPDWGGVIEVPSGTQDGRAVEELLRRMHLRPLGGSGWKVVIVNEADWMTPQAEAMWLDGLEKLPSKTVVIFTTNNLHKMTDRFIRRCEVHRFDGSTVEFREAMEQLVQHVWCRETGSQLGEIPDGLGKFEMADENYSIGLALQQIAPYIRSGDALPERFIVPMIRQQTGSQRPTNGKKARR
jgi:DNA replication protein DnaC/predicted RNA methylase